MIRSVEFKVRRNLKNLPFVENMDHQERVKLMLEVNKVTNSYKEELEGQFYRHLHMKLRDKDKLKDLFIPEDQVKSKKLDWPYGRAIYANQE
jgi:hypothetical protein